MATPKTGAISMNDMRSEINRAPSSSISMSEMRTRYGGSGAISFSDLRGAEGFTISIGTYTDKYGTIYGYYPATSTGGAFPDELDSGSIWHIRFAANSYMSGLTSYNTLSLVSNESYGDSGFTSGFAGTDVTRIVLANTSYSVSGSGPNFTTFSGYSWPTSGTIHCLVKF
jgi:hypothetical protein